MQGGMLLTWFSPLFSVPGAWAAGCFPQSQDLEAPQLSLRMYLAAGCGNDISNGNLAASEMYVYFTFRDKYGRWTRW